MNERSLNIGPINDAKVTVRYITGAEQTFEHVSLRGFAIGRGQCGWELSEGNDRVTSIPADNLLSITWERYVE